MQIRSSTVKDNEMLLPGLCSCLFVLFIGTQASTLNSGLQQKTSLPDLLFELLTLVLFVLIVYYIARLLPRKYWEPQFLAKKPKTLKELNPTVEAEILKLLEAFEQEQRYLEKNMTAGRMALLLQANIKYVMAIIAKYRGKGAIDYINDLKTDYILQLLESESKYRSFTLKALADKAGFGTVKVFSKVFKAKTGYSVSEFVERLG